MIPGADSIKKYWSRYYQGSQGVVFVLDSASSDEDLEVARTELHSALQHPQLCTLPFLILANQQDKPAARSVHEVKYLVHICMIYFQIVVVYTDESDTRQNGSLVNISYTFFQIMRPRDYKYRLTLLLLL